MIFQSAASQPTSRTLRPDVFRLTTTPTRTALDRGFFLPPFQRGNSTRASQEERDRRDDTAAARFFPLFEFLSGKDRLFRFRLKGIAVQREDRFPNAVQIIQCHIRPAKIMHTADRET